MAIIGEVSEAYRHASGQKQQAHNRPITGTKHGTITKKNGSRQLCAIRDIDGAHFDILAGVLFNDSYEVLRGALVSRDIVARRPTFIAHTNSHKFMLYDDVWLTEGVRDVTTELLTVRP
jgi:hypothetical protein